MNDSSAAPDQVSLPVESNVEAEISKLLKQEAPEIVRNVERMRSSLARLSSSSINDLEALTAELKRMQDFLKSEVDSVQHQIEAAFAGIDIIIETIAPWKSTAVPPAPPSSPRAFRAGPAANIEAAQSRRVAGGGAGYSGEANDCGGPNVRMSGSKL